MKMEGITGALLNRAIAIYLQIAFKRHTERNVSAVQFKPEQKLPEILAQSHPFEDLTEGMPGGTGASPMALPGGSTPRLYALRLGNDAYPHMKLALVEAYFPDEFIFAVDRHD